MGREAGLLWWWGPGAGGGTGVGGDTGAESGEKWLWFLKQETGLRCWLYQSPLVSVYCEYLYEPPLLTVTLTPFCSLGSLKKMKM